MPDQVKKDPVTGEVIQDPQGGGEPPQTVTIKKEDWDSLNSKFDTLQEQLASRATPDPPAAPAGPSYTEQVETIDKAVTELNAQIDKAIQDREPISELMNKRDTLNSQKIELQVRHNHIDPIISTGFSTLDQLTGEVYKSQMPYLDIPQVKKSFEDSLKHATPNQRSNPEVRKMLYDAAVGKHHDIILEAKKEEILRDASKGGTQTPGQTRQTTTHDETPAPSDVLSAGANAALTNQCARLGITIDDYYRRRGHKDGWKSYYEKHYKPAEGA